MVRNTFGNAGKGMARCRRCAYETHIPWSPPGQRLIQMSCRRCGADIRVGRTSAEEREREEKG